MSNFNEYIKGYYRGVKSLLIGMRTSMKVFCQKKVTEQYPENRHTTFHIAERHRAMLVMPHDEEGNQPVHCLRTVPDGLSERHHSSDHRNAGNRGR